MVVDLHFGFWGSQTLVFLLVVGTRTWQLKKLQQLCAFLRQVCFFSFSCKWPLHSPHIRTLPAPSSCFFYMSHARWAHPDLFLTCVSLSCFQVSRQWLGSTGELNELLLGQSDVCLGGNSLVPFANRVENMNRDLVVFRVVVYWELHKLSRPRTELNIPPFPFPVHPS